MFSDSHFENRWSHILERVLVNELLELLLVVLLLLVEEVVHVEHEGERHSTVQFLALPSRVVQGESLQLEGKDFRQSVKTVTFGRPDLVAAP